MAPTAVLGEFPKGVSRDWLALFLVNNKKS
jgi:hypothetical protein